MDATGEGYLGVIHKDAYCGEWLNVMVVSHIEISIFARTVWAVRVCLLQYEQGERARCFVPCLCANK